MANYRNDSIYELQHKGKEKANFYSTVNIEPVGFSFEVSSWTEEVRAKHLRKRRIQTLFRIYNLADTYCNNNKTCFFFH